MRAVLDAIPPEGPSPEYRDAYHEYLPLPAYRQRAVVIADSAQALTGSCAGLIYTIASRGHKVSAFAPQLSNQDLRALAHIGAEAYSLPPQLALMDKVRRMRELSNILSDNEPDIAIVQSARHGATSVAAAKIARIPFVVTAVPGLGPAFMEAAGAKAWGERQAMKAVFRTVLSWSDAVIFHSQHDRNYLRAHHLLPGSKMVLTVGGWGEDLLRNIQRPLPPLDHGILFVMVAPMDWYQGVAEFCEAAKAIRAKSRRARFFLASMPGEVASPIPAAALKPYREAVQYIGPSEAASVIARCHVIVAPCWGHMAPRALFQALSVGRPLITTDTRSCRDFVQQGQNGYKVAARDAGALARAMTQILQRPDLMPRMADESRRMAMRLLDMNSINALLLEAFGL